MLTEPQIKIIKGVCEIELQNLEHLKDILYEGDDDFLELIQFDGSGSVEKQLDNLYHSFMALYENPHKVFELTDFETIIFRHILFTWEDKFKHMPNALANLWRKFFIMEKFNNPIAMS